MNMTKVTENEMKKSLNFLTSSGDKQKSLSKSVHINTPGIIERSNLSIKKIYLGSKSKKIHIQCF